MSREQTFPSSEHTTQHPSAHPSASLLSITPSLHLPPAFIFYLPVIHPFLQNLSQAKVRVGIQQFLKHTRCHSPQLAIHLALYLGRAYEQERCGLAARGWTAVSDTLRTTWCSCVSPASLAGVMKTFVNFTVLSVVWPHIRGGRVELNTSRVTCTSVIYMQCSVCCMYSHSNHFFLSKVLKLST